MQVGALRALFEAGYKPDLLVGTSIGAANAVGLAILGFNPDGLAVLESIYRNVADAHLMDPRLGRMMLRALSGRPNHHASQRVREYFIAAGVKPDLRFDQVTNVRLGLVSADLVTGKPVIYGQDPSEFVLDGLMASIALPPWFAPIEKEGKYIVDGGALSNLPIEPALAMGATRIIALNLDDPRTLPGNDNALNQLIGKLVFALSRRHISLEAALAEARGIPIHWIELRGRDVTPIWDFSHYREFTQVGYEIASRTIADWNFSGQVELAYPALFNVNYHPYGSAMRKE
jgi:NTE family protein